MTVPDLSVVKSSNPAGPVSAGDPITYTVSITNSGTTNQTGIVVDDVLPAEVAYVAQSTVVSGFVGSSGTTNKTVRDNFSSVSYTNNNGTDPWAAGWVEVNETTDPASGRITISAGQLRFANLDSRSISRGVNLSSSTIQSAVLTFTYAAGSIGNETLAAQLWNGTSWTTVASITGGSGTITHNLTAAQRSAGTSLRFISASGTWSGSENASVDNVQIAWTETTTTAAPATRDNIPGGANPDLLQGDPGSGVLVAAADGFILLPGASMTVTYQVQVAPTLSGSVSQIVNTASVTSAQQPTGQTITYDISVSHDASSDGSPILSVAVDDPFGIPVYVGGDTNTNGALDVSETWNFTMDYTTLVSDPDPLLNTVEANGVDLDNEDVGPEADTHSVDLIPSGTVTETVYQDVDADGVYTVGTDVPLVGVDVTFADVNGALQTITTDVNGEATALVEAGSTTIDVVDATLPAGVLLVGGSDPTTVTAVVGADVTDETGYAPTGTVSETVYRGCRW